MWGFGKKDEAKDEVHAFDVTCPECVARMEEMAAILSAKATGIFKLVEMYDGLEEGSERESARRAILNASEHLGRGIIALVENMGADTMRVIAKMDVVYAEAEQRVWGGEKH